jgi:hypothetical protein
LEELGGVVYHTVPGTKSVWHAHQLADPKPLLDVLVDLSAVLILKIQVPNCGSQVMDVLGGRAKQPSTHVL